MNWRNNLRIKIIAWSFVPTVIILSAVAWFTFYSYQKVLGDLVIKQDQEIVQIKMGKFTQAVNSILVPSLTSILMEIDIDRDLSLEDRAQNILQQTQGLEVFDGGIYFLDQQGMVFKTQPEQLEVINQDWSDAPQFRYIQDHPNVAALSDLFFIESSGKKIVCSMVAMVSQQAEFVGAGYYCFTIYPPSKNIYFETVKSLGLGPNLLVLDRNQYIIFSEDPSDMGKDVSEEVDIQQLLHGESMSGRFRNGNEDVVLSYAPVGNTQDAVGWIVLNEQSWANIMRPTWPYRQLLYVLLALGVIVPVLVTTYGVRHITEPIQKLIQATAQVTAGQFTHRIEVKTGDEIETLANQFNLMSIKLNESYSLLEKKVADRTRELAIMDAILSIASGSLDIQEILQDTLNITIEQTGFSAGGAFTIESDSATSQLISYRGFEDRSTLDLINIDLSSRHLIAANYQSSVAAFNINDFQDQKLQDGLSQSNLQMLVYVPLSTKGRNLGFFLLGKRELCPPSTGELSLLGSIGTQVGVALENAHLYEKAEQTAITAERNRLARELHDAVTQTLFSANLIADVTPQIWERNPEEGIKNLEELRQLTRGALAEMRTMLLEMRPESLERVGVKALLKQLADAFIGRVRIPISVELEGDCELAQEVKIVFYRVAQETLNNIAKHSGARQVELHLECRTGYVNLWIKDDGLGFDPSTIPPGHMGIAIMRERASSIGATLTIESQIGQGAIVELIWRTV